MRIISIILSIIIISTSLISFALNAQEELTDDDQALWTEILSLDWKDIGAHSLPFSHSTLAVPEGYSAVIGEEARKFEALCDGDLDKKTEAALLTNDFTSIINFYSNDVGYVSLDDWKALNPKALLETILKETEKTNITRRKDGIGELHVVGWVQEPSLDKDSNTVFWAIKCIDDEETLIGSTVLRLGRKGFELITRVTDEDSYTPFGSDFDVMIHSHSFDPGYRYSDFSKEDKLASYGITSLVAEVASGLTDAEQTHWTEIHSLDWKNTGTHSLPLSHSTLAVPEGYSAVIGEEARKFETLSEGYSDAKIEAALLSDDSTKCIYFENNDKGYISLNDWESLNSKELLETISKETEKANITRRKNGLGDVHVVGWVQEPSLNKDSNTVFWAIKCIDGERTIINSTVLRLGRKGFELILCVTNEDSYIPFGSDFDTIIHSHSFDPGYRYSDFSVGDKLASYGIVSLVAATVGGGIVKSWSILLGLKTLWVGIASGSAYLFYKLKNLFRRKKVAEPPHG